MNSMSTHAASNNENEDRKNKYEHDHATNDLSFFLYLDSSNFGFTLMTMKKRNKIMKMINGNRSKRGRGIKFLNWNKSNAFLQNRIEEIEILAEKYRPDLIGLSESNL